MSARLLHEWRVFWSSTTSSMSSCDDEVLADLVVNRRDKWCLLLALQFVVSPLLHSRLRKLSNFWWHSCLLIHQSKHIYTGRSFIFHQVALLFHSSPLVSKLCFWFLVEKFKFLRFLQYFSHYSEWPIFVQEIGIYTLKIELCVFRLVCQVGTINLLKVQFTKKGTFRK